MERMARLARSVKRMKNAGQGCWKLLVISRDVAANMLISGLAGNKEALQYFQALELSLKRLEHSTILCLLCDNEISGANLPNSFVFISALVDDPEEMLCQCLCDNCGIGPDLYGRVVAKLRESMPDLEIRGQVSLPGHA